MAPGEVVMSTPPRHKLGQSSTPGAGVGQEPFFLANSLENRDVAIDLDDPQCLDQRAPAPPRPKNEGVLHSAQTSLRAGIHGLFGESHDTRHLWRIARHDCDAHLLPVHQKSGAPRELAIRNFGLRIRCYQTANCLDPLLHFSLLKGMFRWRTRRLHDCIAAAIEEGLFQPPLTPFYPHPRPSPNGRGRKTEEKAS